MGFRPDGIKSSGMAARNLWQAAATAAAGEVMEGSGLGVSSAGSFLVRQHRGAGGTGLDVIGGVFVEMDDGFVFTMDTPVDRNFVFFSHYLRFIICGQCGETVNSRNISSEIRSG